MFTIYDKNEWLKVLKNFPKPDSTIKDIIWERTRKFSVPLVEIDENDAIEDFKKLKDLDTSSLLKKEDLS